MSCKSRYPVSGRCCYLPLRQGQPGSTSASLYRPSQAERGFPRAARRQNRRSQLVLGMDSSPSQALCKSRSVYRVEERTTPKASSSSFFFFLFSQRGGGYLLIAGSQLGMQKEEIAKEKAKEPVCLEVSYWVLRFLLQPLQPASWVAGPPEL